MRRCAAINQCCADAHCASCGGWKTKPAGVGGNRRIKPVGNVSVQFNAKSFSGFTDEFTCGCGFDILQLDCVHLI
jgi:hypothetical protein